MEQTTEEWEWLDGEVRGAAREFAAQLRTVTDTSAEVPNLDWNVGELAAHLVSLPDLYRDQNALAEVTPPTDFARFSIDVRAHIVDRDAVRLADRLVTVFGELLDEFAVDPWAPRTIYGRETNGYKTAAGMLAELKLHGMDLAQVTGAKVELNRRQANAAICQSMVVAPVFVDRDKARKFDGVYGIRFRGGRDYTYRIEDGVLSVEDGWPAKADARLRADPVAFTLLALERMSPIRAGLLGKVIVYGRKPWKLARTNTIVIDGV